MDQVHGAGECYANSSGESMCFPVLSPAFDYAELSADSARPSLGGITYNKIVKQFSIATIYGRHYFLS